MTKPTILAIAAACALQGCIQYSDTVNRAQFSSFAAAGGQSADTPMFADTTAGNTYPAAESTTPQTAGKKAAKKKTAAKKKAVAQKKTAAQTGGVHPNIVYFFEKLCAGQRKFDPETQCALPDEIDYQDDDVALVSTQNVAGLRGSGGYEYILLDLKGRPGGVLYRGFGLGADVKRKGQRLTITTEGRFKGESKKVINLNGKTRVVDVCVEFGC